MRGVILANEVLDALPCQRVVVRDGEVRELGVVRQRLGGGGRAASIVREGPADARADARRHRASRRARRASCRYAAARTAIAPSSALASSRGSQVSATASNAALVLLFDYGLPRAHYYHPQRTNGTLRCHFKQRAHDDPFINVGVQDITAWVDFTRVAEAADAAGPAGERLRDAGRVSARPRHRRHGAATCALASEARQLLMPGEMGEAFKAMALTRGFDAPLSGFTVQDLRHSL